MKEFIEAFKALRTAPRALWLVIFAFAFDAMAYFGILPLMKPYLGQDIHIRPELASLYVSIFTGFLTLVMLGIGKPTEGRLGIRKSILLALTLSFLGRIIYFSSPFTGGAATIIISLIIIAFGEGILQPVAYAGVKKYTTEETGSMGFAMLYAGLNFGAMLIGPVSAKVRTGADVAYKAGTSALSGFNAVNIVCTGVTLFTLVVFFIFMSKRAEAAIVRNTDAAPVKEGEIATKTKSPFTDPRFLFFIFALLPVRTLFAHQWLTMPEYVLRCYPPEVTDRMEWLVDSMNPMVIFIGVPLITALTRRFHVLTMMITGSFVSAAATFLLVPGPHTSMLILYFVIFSIGEALWSSRFLEYAAELAPPGRVAQYMGVANLPWFVAKTTTGFYSGFILERFVPKEGVQRTGTMWFIYGCIALLSPILLIVASKWIRVGMDARAKSVADAKADAKAAETSA